MRRHFSLAGLGIAAVFGLARLRCEATDEIELPPIQYSQSTPENCVSKLIAELGSGDARLDYDERTGYLPALLKALDVPVESQMLVFSKTSLQRHRISPRSPRAIYFSDLVYVGYCQAGDVLEISAVDPQLGAVFYTLDQKTPDEVRLLRQTENCLVCHSSSRTGGIPGHVARSLFVDSSGQPILSAGSRTVDYTTPFEHRWGGWYVTGTHGRQQHLGNLIIKGGNVVEPVDNAQGQNVTRLDDRFSTDAYLTPHSDIVALMILEHQAFVHNHIAKANYTARQALHYEKEMNRVLGEPQEHRLESTARRIQGAGDDLVEALLLAREAKLSAPVTGTSGYAEKFSTLGHRDAQGRSLRQLDLNQRLFKYPCSYLIDSPAFDALPVEMRDYVWKRLWSVLTESNSEPQFAHLSPADRRAIVEIVADTKQNLPNFWAKNP